MTDRPPKDVENRVEAEIAAFQAAVIDADITFIGEDDGEQQ